MNSREDALYRLTLAKGFLRKAQSGADDKKWDDCLANAQEAVENAGKSILSHFRPVPKRHDVLAPLTDLYERNEVLLVVREKLKEALDAFQDMGLETHVRATYGDEESRTPPWELIREPEAMRGLEKGRRAGCRTRGNYLLRNDGVS